MTAKGKGAISFCSACLLCRGYYRILPSVFHVFVAQLVKCLHRQQLLLKLPNIALCAANTEGPQ